MKRLSKWDRRWQAHHNMGPDAEANRNRAQASFRASEKESFDPGRGQREFTQQEKAYGMNKAKHSLNGK